jgi:hypothetical protein
VTDEQLRELARDLHDAAVTAGDDDLQCLAFDWYQAGAGREECPVCAALIGVLKKALS